MCRLVAYTGYDLLLADVLAKPEDSLIKQSLLARETDIPINGDGFGVGWYVPKVSSDPAVFLSIMPAWNDENLLHLTSKTQSSLFFGHVRNANSGGVNTLNCHPFLYKNWMLMHNGHIDNFKSIKRALRRLLDDDIYNWLRGETDSEHLFALFLQLSKNKDLSKISVIGEVLSDTYKTIQQLQEQYGAVGISYYNICLTDGARIVASRYCTDKNIVPESLHYLKGTYFLSETDLLEKDRSESRECVLIASERLTVFDTQWQTVPANHFILVDTDYSITMNSIDAFY